MREILFTGKVAKRATYLKLPKCNHSIVKTKKERNYVVYRIFEPIYIQQKIIQTESITIQNVLTKVRQMGLIFLMDEKLSILKS